MEQNLGDLIQVLRCACVISAIKYYTSLNAGALVTLDMRTPNIVVPIKLKRK